MHSTKWWALGLVIFCTFFTSTAALLLKKGVMQTNIINLSLFSGLVLYGVAAVFLVIALKFGELSVLYPAVATSFIWVNIFSAIFLNETIPALRWLGAALIILGVSLIGFGSKTGRELQTRYL